MTTDSYSGHIVPFILKQQVFLLLAVNRKVGYQETVSLSLLTDRLLSLHLSHQRIM